MPTMCDSTAAGLDQPLGGRFIHAGFDHFVFATIGFSSRRALGEDLLRRGAGLHEGHDGLVVLEGELQQLALPQGAWCRSPATPAMSLTLMVVDVDDLHRRARSPSSRRFVLRWWCMYDVSVPVAVIEQWPRASS